MKEPSHTFTSQIWLYPGTLRPRSGQASAWYFVTVPKDLSTELSEVYENHKRGWGSLPVTVTLGKTDWDTSIFPDKKTGTYLLPLKSEVRKKENVDEGDMISLTLQVRS